MTATAGWIRDRLFEAGLEDVVDVSGTSIPTVELGGWIALAVWVSFGFALAATALVPTSFIIRQVNDQVAQQHGKVHAVPYVSPQVC